MAQCFVLRLWKIRWHSTWRCVYGKSDGTVLGALSMENQMAQYLVLRLWKIRWHSTWRCVYEKSDGTVLGAAPMENKMAQYLTLHLWKIRWHGWRCVYGRLGSTLLGAAPMATRLGTGASLDCDPMHSSSKPAAAMGPSAFEHQSTHHCLEPRTLARARFLQQGDGTQMEVR